jgi:hypothetical protein
LQHSNSLPLEKRGTSLVRFSESGLKRSTSLELISVKLVNNHLDGRVVDSSRGKEFIEVFIRSGHAGAADGDVNQTSV